jgi:hypothetical protein
MHFVYYVMAFGFICYAAYVYLPEVTFFWIEKLTLYINQLALKNILKEKAWVSEKIGDLKEQMEEVAKAGHAEELQHMEQTLLKEYEEYLEELEVAEEECKNPLLF